MTEKIEFGDFQTPFSLAEKCVLLISQWFNPQHVIEPTCGLGFFIEASYQKWKKDSHFYGFEINKKYIEEFNERCPEIFNQSKIVHADFFDLNLQKVVGLFDSPLVIGNPPWVTNSQLGTLNSKNLPEKTNHKGLSGFEALSGKSNFDISEWMMMKLSEVLANKKGVLAMLCKTSVARNIFLHNNKSGFKNVGYKIFRIDSKKEFNVSVDACFFVVDFYNGGDEKRCEIYNELNLESFEKSIGIEDNKIVANIDLHLETKELVSGNSSVIWRSGIKHDASKVMELDRDGDLFINGFGEIVDIEKKYLFPFLKSSDLANSRLIPRKYVIVPQHKVGEETLSIKLKAPKLWNYLEEHALKLDNRKSSIYKKQPRFSIFGVGDYSFKPFKIAISGLYKKINFCLLTPFDEMPIMVDDTCYMLGFDSLNEAKNCLKILKSDLVTNYVSSLIFWDAKRPINSEILKTIDFGKAEKSYLKYSFNEVNNNG